MDCGEEVAGGLVISRGDGAVLLEPGKEVLDQMARLEQLPVIVAADLPVGLRRDHHGLARGEQRIDDPFLGIERLIGDQRAGLHRRQQLVGAGQIMRLAWGEEEAQGIAQGIDQGMDLGAQPAFAAADRLIAVFFLAPALC